MPDLDDYWVQAAFHMRDIENNEQLIKVRKRRQDAENRKKNSGKTSPQTQQWPQEDADDLGTGEDAGL